MEERIFDLCFLLGSLFDCCMMLVCRMAFCYNGCLDRVKGMGLNQIEWMDPLMGIDFDTVDGNPANQLIW